MGKKKVNFVWKNDIGWTWEAIHYEGNGVFYGKVTSPYVPQGEYGTWYLWEIERDANVRLVKGSKSLLETIRKKAQKKMKMQQAIIG